MDFSVSFQLLQRDISLAVAGYLQRQLATTVLPFVYRPIFATVILLFLSKSFLRTHWSGKSCDFAFPFMEFRESNIVRLLSLDIRKPLKLLLLPSWNAAFTT